MPFDASPSHVPLGLNTQWSSVSSVFEEKLWSRSARLKLEELSKLPNNWDTYGSQPIHQQAIELAADILSDLVKLKMPEPNIFPVPGGGIQLEWDLDNSALEIEILPDKSIEYLIVDKTGEMYEGKISQYNNILSIACLTDWFLNKSSSIKNLTSVYAPTY